MTIIAIISLILFVPSFIYNSMRFGAGMGLFMDDRWRETKNPIYAIGYVISIIGTMAGSGATLMGTIHFYHGNETVMMVVASVSILLTIYFSYYQRFGKSLWVKRFLYS